MLLLKTFLFWWYRKRLKSTPAYFGSTHAFASKTSTTKILRSYMSKRICKRADCRSSAFFSTASMRRHIREFTSTCWHVLSCIYDIRYHRKAVFISCITQKLCFMSSSTGTCCVVFTLNASPRKAPSCMYKTNELLRATGRAFIVTTNRCWVFCCLTTNRTVEQIYVELL